MDPVILNIEMVEIDEMYVFLTPDEGHEIEFRFTLWGALKTWWKGQRIRFYLVEQEELDEHNALLAD